ncbi:uncharacterized protein ABDE67_002479 [Symphorus nematophorus]
MTRNMFGGEKCLKDLKWRYLEEEDRYKSLASPDEMHTKLKELQKQMAWALNRVEEAERKQEQSQLQLHGIMHQLLELQQMCAKHKAEVQKRNAILKSSEVNVFRQCISQVQRQTVTVHRCKANLRDLEKDQLSSRIDDLKLRKEQETLQRSIDTSRRNLQMMESSWPNNKGQGHKATAGDEGPKNVEEPRTSCPCDAPCDVQLLPICHKRKSFRRLLLRSRPSVPSAMRPKLRWLSTRPPTTRQSRSTSSAKRPDRHDR